MTLLYPVVLEKESSGAVSAYVPGLPVYAAADTHAKAERAIRDVLTAYLDAHPESRSGAQVRVARVSGGRSPRVSIVSAAALVGAKRTAVKAKAARENGLLGGRPKGTKASATARPRKRAAGGA